MSFKVGTFGIFLAFQRFVMSRTGYAVSRENSELSTARLELLFYVSSGTAKVFITLA